MPNPFRYFNSSPEVIRLTVMMYVRYPLSLRQVEYLLFERGIDICHETVRFWWNRFRPDVRCGDPDWENDLWPASAEIQVGYNLGPSWAIYAEGLVGVGNDRPFDAGAGLGLRFKY